jgi:hypothetical protein
MKYFNLLAIILICLLGITIYSNTLHSPFHLDDEFSITDNFSIRNISNIKAIWKIWPPRFISNLSLAINYHFGKLDVRGYHAFNIFIHLLSAIAVWWLVLLILSSPAMRDTNIAKSKDIMALFAGLIFVSHPIQTQGVTYIIQRTTSLAALFYILSVCLYAKSRLSHKSAKSLYYYVSSLAFAILAMFTKEFTATLPIAIILYEMSFLKDDKKIRWKYLSPFFVLLFLIPVTMLLAKPVLYIKEKTLGIPLSNYLFTQFRVIVTYIRLLILPINQNVDYDYRISKSPFEAPVLFSLLFLAAIFSAALVLHRRHRLMSHPFNRVKFYTVERCYL